MARARPESGSRSHRGGSVRVGEFHLCTVPVMRVSGFVGRQDELRRIGELTAAAREGRGGGLVLRGEAGVGKTALLDQTRRTATDMRLVDVSGSQFEAELPFALLHQMCVPLLGHLPD